MKLEAVAGVAVVLAGMFAAPSALYASEGDYIGLFGGNWSGSGMVLNNTKPWQVNCHAVGQPSANHLLITGDCSVFLISVPILADVTYDPASGRYSGVYTGGDMTA